ncbi:lysM domain receptor-like kinase 3 [Senna tora]|uniref:LysM domain receptor-like kinase 3 n=1 Tax=Senna tora TaxID=362788 RepID=A0A834X7B7_9FABA|nr:lysM domain receptor-like kinase 3 [Senna tora]
MNSSGIIVTEPSLNAKICHFGAAQLCGEIDKGEEEIVDRLEEVVGSEAKALQLRLQRRQWRKSEKAKVGNEHR